MNKYQTETSLPDKYIRSSRAGDPHSLYADPDPESAVSPNTVPDPGPAQKIIKVFLKKITQKWGKRVHVEIYSKKQLTNLQLSAISDTSSVLSKNSPSWVRIRIASADPEPKKWMRIHADPDPQPSYLTLTKNHYIISTLSSDADTAGPPQRSGRNPHPYG